MTQTSILVGDVGGTNVRFALASASGAGLRLEAIWKREAAAFASFSEALDAFLDDTAARPGGVARGLAGVVEGDSVDLLNRGWRVDLGWVRRRLGEAPLVAVNDFIAMARAAPELGDDELEPVRSGRASPGGCAVVGGPGTGFGLALLRQAGAGWVVIGGEGGHQAYTPQTPLEWELAQAIRARGVYVSTELVTAGAGFELTRDCLAEVMGLPPVSWSQADVIAQALAGEPFSVAFCRLRVAAVMTTLGDAALVCNASGGVFLAGGVANHLAPWFDEPEAIARFEQRGPRTCLLDTLPIHMIVSEAAPLLGAAHIWLDQSRRGWI